MRSFARSFADEFGPSSIRGNSLSPGLVPTGFQERTGNDAEDLEGFGAYVVGIAPLKRFGRPEEIARAAVFLAGDESSYMTASDLVVDGGYMNVRRPSPGHQSPIIEVENDTVFVLAVRPFKRKHICRTVLQCH